MANVYDFTVKDRKGNEVSLSEYKGKVLLIVNTATDADLRRIMIRWRRCTAS